MQPINFVIGMSTMKQLNNWTIFKLRLHKSFKKCPFLLQESNFVILERTLNFWLALLQSFRIWLLNFRSLSTVITRSLTSLLLQIKFFPIFALVHVYKPKLSGSIFLC